MKIAITDRFNRIKIVESTYVPRLGDRVVCEYSPSPIVKNVIWNFDRSSGFDVLIELE